ncbi:MULTISPECIES: hypothetical protein [Rhizobium]|uniref:Uncharacterized protein n=1 Tax=Rhizobium changzhiense TaxID=2692317 RepID=A0A7Z0RLE6_9HYPH|nr:MULTISPECIES: hypothetical protein [Rhizobium]MBA5803193.1 hypothetical protein [Rhizobium changzhiense]MCV9942966.1 hypothetical protein [Rhizobium sp. BT-175]MCW0015074.1 hypothetical protein [Rhizobium sp. BT-226]NNU47526.1 hypothetical protein [Rhizobium changzhiense]NZD62872.1 hypothetical protein [Rhizobium changzhiense]
MREIAKVDQKTEMSCFKRALKRAKPGRCARLDSAVVPLFAEVQERGAHICSSGGFAPRAFPQILLWNLLERSQ